MENKNNKQDTKDTKKYVLYIGSTSRLLNLLQINWVCNHVTERHYADTFVNPPYRYITWKLKVYQIWFRCVGITLSA